MLVMAGYATRANAQEDTDQTYMPDLLVQTASLVDYFFPEEEQATLAQTLASIDDAEDVLPVTMAQSQTKNEGEIKVDTVTDVKAGAEAEVPAYADAIIGSESGSEVATQAAAEATTQGATEVASEAVAEVRTEAEAEVKSEAEAEVKSEAES